MFQAILSDLFPGVTIPEHDYGQLKEEIINVQEHMKLQVVETQIVKVIQLFETMIVRHGVMLVGPTGGGKTVIYRVRVQIPLGQNSYHTGSELISHGVRVHIPRGQSSYYTGSEFISHGVILVGSTAGVGRRLFTGSEFIVHIWGQN